MIKLLFLLLLSTLLFSAPRHISVQLEWKHQFEFAGFYAAIEKGYYRDIGVEVELREYEEGIDISAEVVEKRATLGVSSSSLILDKLQNKPVILIASYFKQNALAFAVKPNITSLKQLKGKKIMAAPYEIDHTSLAVLLNESGLKKNDYTLITHEFNIEKFKKGEVDAMSIFISNQPYFLDKEGVAYDIINPADLGIYSYDLELFTSEEFAMLHPEIVKKFVEATNMGWAYAFEHKREMVDLIYEKYSKKKTKESLLYEADKTEDLFKTNIFKIGAIVPELIQLNAQMYANLGLIKNGVDTTNLLSTYVFENLQSHKKNISKNEIANVAHLSDVQKEYLKQKGQLRACIDPDWMPFEGFENGKHVGLSADYLEIFEKNIGIPITVVKTDSWSQSLEFAKERKCDILTLVMETNERKKYLNFTQPYLKTPVVLVTKPDVAFVADFSTIKEKKLGIPAGYSFGEILKQRYPNLNIISVANENEGLEKVNRGEIFGYIGTLATVGYLFQKEFTGELKIAGKFDDSWDLGIGVRDDDLELLQIMEKAIWSIDEEMKQNIFNKWVAINYQRGIDYDLVYKITIFSFVFILAVLYWNRRLSLLNRALESAKQKAQEATQTKSNFLANMSHEIRTPMNSIVSMIYLLKKEATSDIQLKYINIIENASNTLLSLLNDILDLSKIEAKKLKINNSCFNLSQTLENIKNLLKVKADEKGLEFEIFYDKSVPIWVIGDNLRVTQILINLISNAIKFTHDGFVKISAGKIADNIFRFEVHDSGIGLSEEQKAKLFLSFTQADEGTTRKYGGTGLGLAICKELVEMMGGKIMVESALGEGSKFIFEITLQESSGDLENNKIEHCYKEEETKEKEKELIVRKTNINETQKELLFKRLEDAVASRRPTLCESIIEQIERYNLDEDSAVLFEKVKKLTRRYKFNEAKEAFNAK